VPADNPVDRAGAASGYVPVNGLDVYYEIHGDGSPLILLHGAMGTIDSCFAKLLPALSARRQVIALELQGHGHTPDADRPLSYQQMAADAAGVMQALGVGKADLVGYSLGGAVAMQMAIQHPGMVRRVVFFGGTSYRRDGLYPEALADPGSAADDLTGSVWHKAYLQVAPDPGKWPVLVAKTRELDRDFAGRTRTSRGLRRRCCC
jgi:pimeloyl-ACP methyl ester carboxylesterase